MRYSLLVVYLTLAARCGRVLSSPDLDVYMSYEVDGHYVQYSSVNSSGPGSSGGLYPSMTLKAYSKDLALALFGPSNAVCLHACLPLKQGCEERGGKARDSSGYACETYYGYESYCGKLDDGDFQARAMCCACGGGAPSTTKGVLLYDSADQIAKANFCADPSNESTLQPFCFREEAGEGLEPFVLGYWSYRSGLDRATFIQAIADLPLHMNYTIGDTFAAPAPKVKQFGDPDSMSEALNSWTILRTFNAEVVDRTCLAGNRLNDTTGNCEACPSGEYRTPQAGIADLGCRMCPANAESPVGAVDEQHCRCRLGFHSTLEVPIVLNGSCVSSYNGVYTYAGLTANGAPFYKALQSQNYVYHDPDCSGSGAPAAWILDVYAPLKSLTKDLDGDRKCVYFGYTNAEQGEKGQGPPNSTTWKIKCPTAFKAVNISIVTEVQYGGCTSPAFCHPRDNASSGAECRPCDVCLACRPGKYGVYNNHRPVCIGCGVGNYTNDEGSTICLPIPRGWSGVGMDGRASPCPAGSAGEISDEGLPLCVTCGPGYFGSWPGFLACEACPPGQFSNGTNNIACTATRPGYFQSSSGRNSEVPCPVGTANPLFSGAAQCEECRPGSYSNATGSTACTPTAFGRYQSEFGQTLSLPCPEGTHNPWEDGAASCRPCWPGFYASSTGAATCTPTMPGFFQNGFKQTGQIPCPVGMNSPSAVAEACLPCRPGTYANSEGTSLCLPTAPGYYQNASGQAVELPCPRGTFNPSDGGTKKCDDCPSGKYGNIEGASGCLRTPPGLYQPLPGKTFPLPCPLGTHNPSTAGAETCELCPPGTFSAKDAASACTSCEPGTYQDGFGETKAIKCPVGNNSPAAGAKVCVACAAGSFSNTPGLSNCIPTPPGYFQATAGETLALPCGPGTHNPGTSGAAECQPCPPGRTTTEIGTSKCEPAPLGRYQPSQGQTVTFACPAGKHSPVVGAEECIPCAPGTYSNTIGVSACTNALPGHYQNESGQKKELPCPAGLYSSRPLGGADLCDPCAQGHWSNLTGATICSRTMAGFFQNVTGQTQPIPCPVGKYTFLEQQSSCFACPPGRSADTPGLDYCKNCPRGMYSEIIGAVNCTTCDANTFTKELASTSVEDCQCQISHYGRPPNCIQCTEGMVCDDIGMLFPMQDEGYNLQVSMGERRLSSINSSASNTSGTGVLVYIAYKCRNILECPSGPPGTCAKNRDPMEIGCAACFDNFYSGEDEAECQACSGGEGPALLTLLTLAGLFVLSVMAFALNRNAILQKDATTNCVVVMGQTVGGVQTMAVFNNLSARWVDPLRGMLVAISGLSFDLKFLKLQCMVGSNSAMVFACRQAVVPMAAIFLAMAIGLKKRFYDPELHYRVELVNTAGTICNALFVSIVLPMTMPFVCYPHPGNLGSSLVSDPSVKCFEDAAHWSMVTVSICAGVLVLFPYLSLVTWAIAWHRRKMTSVAGSARHLRMFRFLFFQFQPHAYYFGGFVSARGLLVCFVPVVAKNPAVQIISICAVLHLFQIASRCVRPWRSFLADFVDGILSILILLVLLCAAMSSKFEDADILIGWVGALLFLLFFGFALSAVCFGFYRRFRPAPYYERFICHHKADAAAQARYLQMLFIQKTGQGCFIDSDHLTHLDMLFDTVRCKIGSLIVYLTSDTMKRPWCAGEITITFMTHKRAIVIETPSFVPPTEEEMEVDKVHLYLANLEVKLHEYGIANPDMANAFRWLISEPNKVVMNRELIGRPIFNEMVDNVLNKHYNGNMLKALSTSRTVGRTSAKRLSAGTVMISTCPGDDEAVASAAILVHMTQEAVLEFCKAGILVLADLDDTPGKDVYKAVCSARAVVIMLSAGSLESPVQLQIIMDVMSVADEVEVIPMITSSFRFPTKQFLEEEFGRGLSGDSDVDEMRIRLTGLFKRIAVTWATASSLQVLIAQAADFTRRIPRNWKGKDSASTTATASRPRLSVMPSNVSRTSSWAKSVDLEIGSDEGADEGSEFMEEETSI